MKYKKIVEFNRAWGITVDIIKEDIKQGFERDIIEQISKKTGCSKTTARNFISEIKQGTLNY